MHTQSIVQLERENFLKKDTILRSKTVEVVEFGDELHCLIEALIYNLKKHEIAIGFAAPQIGSSMRVAVININPDKVEPTLIMVNPKIISTSGKKDVKKEACMSLPHYRGPVKRRDKIEIEYQDGTGKACNLKASGFYARVIGHEIDHLDGILYVDRMESLNDLEKVDFFKE